METAHYESLGLNRDYVQRLTAPSRELVERMIRGAPGAISSSSTAQLPETRELFARKVLQKADLIVDSSFWEIFQPDYGFELWSFNFEYLAGCGKFYTLTSYSQDELLSNSWFDLFGRDEIHIRQSVTAIQKVEATLKPVLNVTPPHLVTEKKSTHKISVLVTVKAIYPAFLKEDSSTAACFIAISEYKRPLSDDVTSENSNPENLQ